MRSIPLIDGESSPASQYNSLQSDAGAAGYLLAHQQLGILALPVNPSNTQTATLTINGSAVVFTFVSVLGVTPGDVLIGGSPAETAANWLALAQHSEVTTSKGVALAVGGQQLLSLCGFALNGTNLTIWSQNNSTYAPLTSFAASTTATGGSWTGNTMALYVEPGNFSIGGSEVIFAGGNSPTITAPAVNPRIDLLAINSSGTLSLVTGAENVSPVAPTFPKDKIVICEIFNTTAETSINDFNDSTNGYIKADVRPFLNNGRFVSQTTSEIYGVDGSNTDNYVIALNPIISGYVDGQIIQFKVANPNTTAVTLDAGGGAKSVFKNKAVALVANDILADQIMTVAYESVTDSFQLVGNTGNSTLGGNYFGDGSDGNVVIAAGTTTATKDMFYNNLTIQTGGILDMNGFMLFVNGTFTPQGTGKVITSGTAGTNGSPGAGQSHGGGGSGAAARNSNTLWGGNAGITGGDGADGGRNQGGATSPNATNSALTNNGWVNSVGVTGAVGGNGGTGIGYAGGGSGTGGSPAGGTQVKTKISDPQIMRSMIGVFSGATIVVLKNSTQNGAAAGGGGGGSGNPFGTGGGGGGAGGGGSDAGNLVGFIRNIDLSTASGNQFEAIGGDGGVGGGGAAGSTLPGGGNGGGGGGGGGGTPGNGGIIALVVHAISGGSISHSVAAGACVAGSAGAGAGAGAGGAPGSTVAGIAGMYSLILV